MAYDIGKPQGVITDRSGSAGTGASTQIAAANPNRRYLFIQNLDGTNPIYIGVGAAATADKPSIKIAAGTTFKMTMGDFVSTDVINVISTGGTVKYTAQEA